MSDEIAMQLQGTAEEARAAAQQIEQEIQTTFRRKTGVLAGLKYELQVLRKICVALQAKCYKNGDIYCDIVEQLIKYTQPYEPMPRLWETYLNSMHFIHNALSREHYNACQRIYAIFTTQKCQLLTAANYKIYLQIHMGHFNIQQLHLEDPTSKVAAGQMCLAAQELGKLFVVMHKREQDQHFDYGRELLDELNKLLLGKRSAGFLKIFASQPDMALSQMYDALFKLLGSRLYGQFADYMCAFNALVQIDVFSQSLPESQFALNFLASCRQLFKANSAQYYTLQLLYYMLKMLYAREDLSLPAFRDAYMDLCKKFVIYLEKNAEVIKETWFPHVWTAWLQLLYHLHATNKKSFCQVFWELLRADAHDKAQALTAHMQLLDCLCRLQHTYQLGQGQACSSKSETCTSNDRHADLMFAMCAVVAYSDAPQLKPTAQLVKFLLSIVGCGFKSVSGLSCMNISNWEFNYTFHYLISLVTDVGTPAQMAVVLQLINLLQPVLHLIAPSKLCILQRKLYKASTFCNDSRQADLLKCAYITSLNCNSRQHMHLAYFYRDAKPQPEQCVSELYSSCWLNNNLSTDKQLQLYESDMDVVLSWYKSNEALLQSLLRCCPNDYMLVLLARQLRTNKLLSQKIDELRAKLTHAAFKKTSQSALTPLQQLIIGHVNACRLIEAIEAQKVKISTKLADEKSLKELLIKHKGLDMHLGSEHQLLDIANASINGFTTFYEQYIVQPLNSSEVLLDWEALIDDLSSTANLLVTMGYMTLADKGWLLVLRITKMLGDRYGYLRGFMHFLSRAEFYEQSSFIDMSGHLKEAQRLLDELVPNFPISGTGYRRQQTVLLLCLCHMAHYYARRGWIHFTQMLLLLVQRLHKQCADRCHKQDIVQLTMQLVHFRLLYQQEDRNCHPLPTIPTSLHFLDTMMDNMRQFESISSLDSNYYIQLMCDLVRVSSECTANRMSEKMNVLISVFVATIKAGLVLRSVELLVSWLWLNLQMENLDRAQLKLELIDHFLCIKPLSPLLQQNEQIGLENNSKQYETEHMNELMSKMFLQHQQIAGANVEPIRKQNIIELSDPIIQKIGKPSPTCPKLQRYISFKPPNSLLKNAQLQCLYVIVGCLHARLFFLRRELGELDEFYTNLNVWLQQSEQEVVTHSLGHLLLVQYQHQVNYYRSKKQHKQALSAAHLALSKVNNLQQKADMNYHFNLLVQLKTIKVEMRQPIFQQPQRKQLRRALLFNVSPEEKPATTNVLCSVKKNKPYSALKKPNAFKIYTELEPTGTFATSRPTRRNNRSSPTKICELETISGSSSSSSPVEELGIDLNACQIIDLSDEDEQQPTVTTATVQCKRRAAARVSSKACLDVPKTIKLPNEDKANGVTRTRLHRSKSSEIKNSEATKKATVTRARLRRLNTDAAGTNDFSGSTRRRQRN